MLKGMNNQSVRKFNAKLTVRLLYQYHRLSKSHLSRHLDLSIPAISKILTFLEDKGWVEHVDSDHKGLFSIHHHVEKTLYPN